jgi:hypothetical protein
LTPVNLRPGKGQRNLTCDLYCSCLNIAAKKDWKSFNCESCDNNKPVSKGEFTVTRAENEKVCKKCDKRPANKAWETKKIAKRNASIIKEIEALIGKPRNQIVQ